MYRDLLNDIKTVIPEEGETLSIKDYYTRPAILIVNLGGDEIVVVGYKNKKDVFIDLILRDKDKMKVIASIKNNAIGIKDLMAVPTEIKGENDLVIGWDMKDKSKLGIYRYSRKSLKSVLNENTHYNKLESGDMKSDSGYDGLYEFAIWTNDGSGDYNINVYRLKNGKMILAKDVYKSYFKDVANYYLNEIDEKGVTDIRLLKLAKAEYLSASPKAALNTLNAILNLEKSDITKREIKKFKEELKENI